MTSARDLADRFHRRWLGENPFAASMYGIPGYDDLVPDESEAGGQAWRAEVSRFLQEADTVAGGPLTPADAVTLACTTEAAVQELASIDLARAEYTVTAMQYAGPATFMAVAARTVLVDPAAAEAYLTRLRRSGTWLDQIGDRLRAGAAKGRLPVAPLAAQAIGWAEEVLAAPAPGPVLSPRPPQGWQRAAAWEDERRAIAAEVVKPALARWLAAVRELLPRARPSEQAGLAWLPGGEEDYARAVRVNTTLPLSPEQLHQTGLVGRPGPRQQFPDRRHPPGQPWPHHLVGRRPAFLLPGRRAGPPLWRACREHRTEARQHVLGPGDGLLGERSDRQPPLFRSAPQLLAELVEPGAAAPQPDQVGLRRHRVHQDRPRGHRQEGGRPGELHGGDGVLGPRHVDVVPFVGARLPDAAERDGVGRAERPGSDRRGLLEKPLHFGAPGLLARRALVREQVVVPGDAVHGGGERILLEPALMEAVGQVAGGRCGIGHDPLLNARAKSPAG